MSTYPKKSVKPAPIHTPKPAAVSPAPPKTWEKKPMEGALFPREKTSDYHPDLGGYILIDGTEFFLAAWGKVSRNGEAYFKLVATRRTTEE